MRTASEMIEETLPDSFSRDIRAGRTATARTMEEASVRPKRKIPRRTVRQAVEKIVTMSFCRDINPAITAIIKGNPVIRKNPGEGLKWKVQAGGFRDQQEG